jgi:hypothetical protein
MTVDGFGDRKQGGIEGGNDLARAVVLDLDAAKNRSICLLVCAFPGWCHWLASVVPWQRGNHRRDWVGFFGDCCKVVVAWSGQQAPAE